MTNQEIDKIIAWCKQKLKAEQTSAYGLKGKKLEGYEEAMQQVMSALHRMKVK